jgi:CRISPR/Cas system-associated endonuclease Cas3-HD
LQVFQTVNCRKIVEEHIVIDLKIMERCKKIMDNYEQRINDIEIEMVKKCDEPRAREIVKEELELNSCNELCALQLFSYA